MGVGRLGAAAWHARTPWPLGAGSGNRLGESKGTTPPLPSQQPPGSAQVFDHRSGRLVGLVTEVYDAVGAASTLRIRLAPNREDLAKSTMRTTLLPFATEMVPVVDVGQGRMEVGAARAGMKGRAARMGLRRDALRRGAPQACRTPLSARTGASLPTQS